MKRILALASLALALSSQAFAADLYQPEPVAPPAEPVVVASNGWYLRGDVSYDFMNLRGVNFQQGVDRDDATFGRADLNDTGNIGIGVGYQLNDYVRFDKTFDYMFSSDFRGTTTGRGGDTGSVCDDGCKSTDRTSLTAFSMMANAYVDIAHYGILTPYVGVGLGATHVKWDGLKNTSCSTTTGDCDDYGNPQGRESWRFTYGLMAGTAIDINCKLKADVGYRYRHVDGGPMFGRKLNGGPGRDDGFDIHEARAGLRYSFGDDNCQQAYLPPAEMPQQQPVYK
jgi:opacity protein-like surface antigen